MNVILLSPDKSNGGITSWTKKFLKTFPNEEVRVYHVSQEVKAKPSGDRNIFSRVYYGGNELLHILPNLKRCMKEHHIDLLHTTTSGFMGAIRDIEVGKLCCKRHISCILHFRIGCIPQMYNANNFWWKLMFHAMKLYTQVWVLDRKTYNVLSEIPELKGKIFLTPNSMEVKPIDEIAPKQYKRFVFMANVLPEKGIFELTEAFKTVKDKSTELHILGPGRQENLKRMKEIAGELWGKRIIYHGKLPNDEAVKLLANMDSMVLPTYYWGEAFPISILEALSTGKLVISCPRAAVADILTAVDGSRCGILVDERSVSQLTEAIDWVCEHKLEADELCRKGYEKVYVAYRTDVVYEIYRSNYRKALSTYR